MLRIINLLSSVDGTTKPPGLNSEQINFRELPSFFTKHGKLIDMNNLANMGTLQKHQEIL